MRHLLTGVVSGHERGTEVSHIDGFWKCKKLTCQDMSFSGRTARPSEPFVFVCASVSCPVTDGLFSKKPTHLSAPAYVEALMTWTQSILDDEKNFPQKIGESISCVSYTAGCEGMALQAGQNC